jgi:hypothetical protein
MIEKYTGMGLLPGTSVAIETDQISILAEKFES